MHTIYEGHELLETNDGALLLSPEKERWWNRQAAEQWLQARGGSERKLIQAPCAVGAFIGGLAVFLVMQAVNALWLLPAAKAAGREADRNAMTFCDRRQAVQFSLFDKSLCGHVFLSDLLPLRTFRDWSQSRSLMTKASSSHFLSQASLSWRCFSRFS